MRQLLMNMNGVVVAGMPRPVVQPGSVLIRVRYSLVSVGTEVAPVRPASVAAPDTTAVERGLEHARVLKQYFRASLRNPRKAVRRLSQMAERRLATASRAWQTAAAAPPNGVTPEAPSVNDLHAQGWPVGYSVAGGGVAGGGRGGGLFSGGPLFPRGGAGGGHTPPPGVSPAHSLPVSAG